jgi:hypothetical protein
MATFVYDEGEYGYIEMKAERGEEIPLDMVQAFALLRVGGALDFIGRAIYELSEQVQSLSLKD